MVMTTIDNHVQALCMHPRLQLGRSVGAKALAVAIKTRPARALWVQTQPLTPCPRGDPLSFP